MKIKTLVAMLFLSAGATTVVAQDATNCNSNSSISHEAVRAGNFKDAYTPWKAVLENCPTLRFYTFTDGYKILKGLMGQIKDRNNPDYQKYYNNIHACCMMLKDYLDSKEGEEFKTLLACAFQDSYDFEESSYGELEVAAAFHKSVYNMMTVDEIETFLY